MSVINRINGPMLSNNLSRLGVDLAFENDLLYIDVNNNRIGIKNNMPTVTLDVNGTVMIGGNLKITGANLASNITDGNINLTPNGSGIVVVTTGLYVSANANVGNLNTNGNINSAANIVGANITANSNIYSPAINNGNSNVRIAANSNVSVSVAGTSNVFLVTDIGANISGNLDITGNISANNFSANALTANSMSNGNSNVRIAANANVTVSANGAANVLSISEAGANISGTANITGNISTAGNVNLTASGARIRGDFSNNTALTSRVMFQTSVADSATGIGAMPSGTGSYASWLVFSSSDANNSSWAAFHADQSTTHVGINSGNTGTGTTLPIALQIDNANILLANSFGITVTGVANISGNANVGNLGTATAIISTGNITTINSGLMQNGNSNVSITANGNVTVTATSTATLVVTATGANITGTANVSGNANVGNLGTSTAIISTGNITTINSGLVQNGTSNVTLTASGNVSTFIGGNATAQLVVTDTGANIAGTANVVGNANVGNIGAADAILTSNIKIGGNSIKSSTGNVAITLADKDVTIEGNLDVKGTVTLIESTTITVNDKNVVLGNTASTGAALDGGGIDLGNNALVTFRYNNSTTSWQSNVALTPTANGTLTLGGTSNYWGNAYVSNLLASGTANIVGNANVGNLGVTQVIATGNITGGNLLTSGSGGNISGANVVLANTFTSNVTTGTAPFVINSTTQVANLNAAIAGSLINGNSNVSIPSANGNVIVSVGGTVNVQVWSTAGANITGTLGVSGNANVGNLGTATAIITTGNITTINSGLLQNSTSNVTIASAGNVSTFVAGNATAQLVVTSTGANIAGTANVVGNANLGNVGTNILLATGNVTGANFLTTGNANIGNVYINDRTISTLLTNANLNINANGSGYITLNAAQNSANVVINGSTANLLYVDGVNNSIGVLTNTIPTNVTVKVNSTNSVIMPVGNSVQRPSTPIQAMFRFNTDTLNYEFYDGSQWKQASSTFTVVSADEFIGDGLTSVYTLSQSSTTNATLVSVDGNVQVPTTAYTVSSTTLTFNPGYVPGAGTKVDLRVITTSTTVTKISDGDTSVTVSDTGSDGTVTITADGSSRLVANAWINANAAIVSRLAGTSVGAAAVVIDTFDKTLFRSAKYVVQVSNSGRGDYETSEYIATHNDTTAYGTSYGIVYSNVELGNVSVAINSGNVELTYTGNYAGNIVKLFKEYIPV